MTLYESNLKHYAKTILRVVDHKTIIKVYYRPMKDEIFLAKWPQEEDAILIKTYDCSVRNWSDEEVEHDLVKTLRNSGVKVEVA